MRKTPVISPCTITKYGDDGEILSVEVVTRRANFKQQFKYEGELVRYRYKLIAVQETGEEMYAGRAKTESEAMELANKWMKDHPEHVSCTWEKF